MRAGGACNRLVRGRAKQVKDEVKTTSTQRKALLCLLLSGAIFITWGSYIGVTSYSGMGAFKAVFYGTRCLIRHSDPYSPTVLQELYQSEGGTLPSDPAKAFFFRRAMLVCVNLPHFPVSNCTDCSAAVDGGLPVLDGVDRCWPFACIPVDLESCRRMLLSLRLS